MYQGTFAWVFHIRSQFKNSDESLREAEAKFKQGKYAEAEPLFLLGLVLLERTSPEDHPDVLSCMEKLGDTFYASEKFKDAQPVYRRLVGIREKSSQSILLTISAMFKLAKTHERLTQPDEAEELYRRAVKLGENTTGPLYANLCDNFAAFLKRTNRSLDEAARLADIAKKRRAADATSAEAIGSTTLQVAAVRLEDTGNGLTTKEQRESADADTEEKKENEAPQKNYSLGDLNAIRPPSQSAPLQAPEQESQESATVGDGEELSDGPSYDASLLSQDEPTEPQSTYSAGDLDAVGTDDASKDAFDIADLDAIKSPSAADKAKQSGSAFNKSKLDAFRASSASGPAGSKSADKPKAPEPFPAGALDAIGGLKASPAARSPLADGAPTVDKSALDAIKPPGADKKPPEPIESAPRADTKKALSATRGGQSLAAPPADMSHLQQFALPAAILVVIVAFVGVMAYISMSNSNPANGPTNGSLTGYIGKSYVSADHKQHFSITTANKGTATIQSTAKKPLNFEISLREYTGNPMEELQTVFGSFDKAIWLQNGSKGLKDADGGIFYVADSPDAQMVDKMWAMADAVQMFYKQHGRYPRQPYKDPQKLRKLNARLSYDSPYTDGTVELPELTVIHWSAKEPAANPLSKTPMEDKWLSGTEAIGPGLARPGLMRCGVLSWPDLDLSYGEDPNKFAQLQIDDFFIEGYNRYNELIQGLNGDIFLISLRKGQDTTPPTAVPLTTDSKGPVVVVISDSPRPDKTFSTIKYSVLFVLILVGTIVSANFTAIRKWLRRGQ